MMKDESVFAITFILKCEVIYILVYLNRLNKIRNSPTRVLTIWWFNLFIRVNFFACFYKLFFFVLHFYLHRLNDWKRALNHHSMSIWHGV